MTMSRNRPRSPRYADHVLGRLATAAEQLADNLRPAPALAEAPMVNLTACRYLSLRHHGQWIEIPGCPKNQGEKTEPSQLTISGVLVGTRPGGAGRNGQPATRGLVIVQGGEQGVHYVRVDEPVNTYPRSLR
jgi:hypothetical protein